MNFRKQSKFTKMFKFVNKINISTWSRFAVLLKKQVCYMIGLDKTKTNWFGWERIGFILFLANFFLKGRVVIRRGGQNRSDHKFRKDIIDLTIAVLLHFKSNFDGHFISILAPRYVL